MSRVAKLRSLAKKFWKDERGDIGSAIAAGSALLGAGANIFGAQSAASAQTNAAQQATQAQLQMFNVLQQNLQPYNQLGQNFANQLQGQIGSLTAPFNPTMQQLEQTPGYQFTLDQGMKAAQNNMAAKGLGSSGNAIAAGENYATGLASTTYQQQFQNYLAQNQQIYNMLTGGATLGENAAAGVGTGAIQTGNAIGSNLIGAGNAQAGANIATGSAVGQGLNQGLLTYLLLNNASGLGTNALGGGGNSSANPLTSGA